MAAANHTVHDPFETALLKAAMQHNFECFADNIQSQAFCVKLKSRNIISRKESEHLSKEDDNKGITFQAELALRYVLGKPAEQVWESMQVLESTESNIHQKILETMKQIKAGKVQLTGLTQGQTKGASPEEIALAVGTILLAETEETLKKYLPNVFKKSKYKTVADVLKQNQSLIKEKWGLSKAQYQSLFSRRKTPSLTDIDITVTVMIFKLLLDIKPSKNSRWRKADDQSLVNHIVRLNRIRNAALGCLLMPDIIWDIEEMYSLLCHSLLFLKVSSYNEVKWKALLLHPDLNTTCTIRDQLKSWMSSDRQDMTEMFDLMEPHLRSDESLTALYKDYGFVKTDIKSNFMKIPTILEKLPIKMMHAVLLHRSDVKLDVQDKVIVYKIDRVKEKVESIKDGQKGLEQKLDDLSRDVIQRQAISQQGDPSVEILHSVRSELLNTGDLFRILILDQPEMEQGKDLDEFCKAFGCVAWDFIIDLDHYSRTKTGLHERISNVLKTMKDIQPVTYDQISYVSESDKKIIANGEKTLWYLANGCADTDVESIQKRQVGKTLTPIGSLLTAVLSKVTCRKSVSLWNVIMTKTDTVPGLLPRILQRIDEICQSVEHINYQKSCLYNIYTKESSREKVPDVDSDLEQRCGCVTYQDFSNVFQSKWNTNSRRYYYPGIDDRTCELSEEEIVQHQIYVEFYHFDIGRINYADMESSKIEELMETERINFLKGNPLTPEAQFVNPKHQVYVLREEMIAAKKKVCGLLRERAERTRRRNDVGHFTIDHDASGGGTTTARYLLYSLRELYPCLEIKRIEPQTIKYLHGLFGESKKPLLLVVDDHEFGAKNADVLQQELENSNIKALVIHVQRMKPVGEKNMSGTNNYRCYISSELKEEDKEGFRQLYRKVTASKVILFGLLAFCEEYDQSRLTKHISVGMINCSSNQKEALGIVLMFWKYCRKPVKLTLISICQSESESENLLQDIFGYYNCDFVKTCKTENSVCPVHQCVVKPLLEALMKEREENCESTLLVWFMDILFQTMSKTSAACKETDQMSRHLFIDRQDDCLSLLVKDLGDECGKEYTAEQIFRFSQLYKGLKQEGHMRALYARYLTYEMNQLDKGLEEIRLTVGLHCGQSIKGRCETNETAIIGSYGNLYKVKAIDVFKTSLKSSNADEAIKQSIVHFQEAVDAFQIAQQLTLDSKQYIADNFLGEVRARHKLLSLCLWDIYRGNFARFREFRRTTTHLLIRDSHEQALEVLDRLDNLQRLNKLDEISERTSKQITRLKFMLLKLNFEDTKTKEDLIAAAERDSHACFDIGLIVRLEYDNLNSVLGSTFQYHLKDWSDLHEKELMTIITFVQNRIECGSKKLHSYNYDALLSAMIHVRHRERTVLSQIPQINIAYAIECSKRWLEYFPQDHRASFTLGALYLARGIEEGIANDVKEGVRLLKKCEEICKANRSAKLVMVKRWSIGSENGLKKLIPYWKGTPMQELAVFQGRQTYPRSPTIKVRAVGDSMQATFYGDERRKVDDGQQSNLEFNICLRHQDPIIAFNLTKA